MMLYCGGMCFATARQQARRLRANQECLEGCSQHLNTVIMLTCTTPSISLWCGVVWCGVTPRIHQKGYDCVIVMAESFSIERRKIMRMLGAKVVLTPAANKGTGMVKKVRCMRHRQNCKHQSLAHYHTTPHYCLHQVTQAHPKRMFGKQLSFATPWT